MRLCKSPHPLTPPTLSLQGRGEKSMTWKLGNLAGLHIRIRHSVALRIEPILLEGNALSVIVVAGMATHGTVGGQGDDGVSHRHGAFAAGVRAFFLIDVLVFPEFNAIGKVLHF